MSAAGHLPIDPARRCMLVERVAEIFNDIPMVGAAQRVIVVGKGVQQAALNNDRLKTLITETRYVEAMHAAARARAGAGATGFPPALQTELTTAKEAQRG